MIFKKKVGEIPAPLSMMATLKQKSEEAISVFKSTVVKLQDVNAGIEQEVINRKSQINELEAEIADLNTTQLGNQKIVNKINEFLN